MRSGDEPMHARSPLRLRLVMALFGALTAGALGLLLWTVGHRPVEALFALAVAGLALVNAAVVIARLRAGPHYQPGRDVPPYRPVNPGPERATGTGRPVEQVSERIRRRRYLALMSVCLGLITLAWVWVRLVSVPIAVAMSMVAMVIPPVASIVANAGWNREGDRPEKPTDRRGP